MINNISFRNKDGYLMTVGEFDTEKKNMRLYWAKSRADVAAAAELSAKRKEMNDMTLGLNNVPLRTKYPDLVIPEGVNTVEFIDKDYDIRYVCGIEQFKKCFNPETKTYEVNLRDFKKTR